MEEKGPYKVLIIFWNADSALCPQIFALYLSDFIEVCKLRAPQKIYIAMELKIWFFCFALESSSKYLMDRISELQYRIYVWHSFPGSEGAHWLMIRARDFYARENKGKNTSAWKINKSEEYWKKASMLWKRSIHGYIEKQGWKCTEFNCLFPLLTEKLGRSKRIYKVANSKQGKRSSLYHNF